MNKLFSEFKRLYFLEEQPLRIGEAYETAGPGFPVTDLFGEKRSAMAIVDSSGQSRTLVLAFKKAGDWNAVAALYQAVQEELGLPAPAIAVAGPHGFSMWFSLAQALPSHEGAAFLQALRLKYLAEIPEIRLQVCPNTGNITENWLEIIPNYYESTDKWSAFIDPSMGSMFIEETGLDMAPNLDRQADFLAGLRSIKPVDFQRALEQLENSATREMAEIQAAPSNSADRPLVGDTACQTRLNLERSFDDPRSFLMAVMNDPTASPLIRVEAAKALLPYFENPGVHSDATVYKNRPDKLLAKGR